MAASLVEFLILFFFLPSLFAFTRHRLPALPALWALTGYCLFVLLRDPVFHRLQLTNWGALKQAWISIVVLFAACLMTGSLLVRRWAPELFLSFPKSNPRIWALVMVLYPILSVYPQGIVYRAFLFDRYRHLFPAAWMMMLASALAFAYVHVIFRNWLAVGLTFIAGILFAWRYWETQSLFVSSFEHALYGCALFTVGLGRSFYFGAVQR